jgi:hypothetical protein
LAVSPPAYTQKRSLARDAANASASHAELKGLELSQDPLLLANVLFQSPGSPWTGDKKTNLVLQLPSQPSVQPGQALTITALLSTSYDMGKDKVFVPFSLASGSPDIATNVHAIAAFKTRQFRPKAGGSIPLSYLAGGILWSLDIGYKMSRWNIKALPLHPMLSGCLAPGEQVWLRLALAPAQEGSTIMWVYMNGHLVGRSDHPVDLKDFWANKAYVVAPATGDNGEVATTQVHAVWQGTVSIDAEMQRKKPDFIGKSMAT